MKIIKWIKDWFEVKTIMTVCNDIQLSVTARKIYYWLFGIHIAVPLEHKSKRCIGIYLDNISEKEN